MMTKGGKTFLKKVALGCGVAVFMASCGAYYADQVIAPTEQELTKSRQMAPSKALREGVFHMQQVESGSRVRVADDIRLKKPNLPPFDVAYVGRNVESVLLELANAAGESIVIPQGLRNRSITLIHNGANFQEMLDIVLGKIGYHYNYVDGVWYITRYPIRTYALEIGQSNRKGALMSDTELSPETGGGGTAAGGTPINTDYTDELWAQVETTVTELINTGKSEATGGGTQAAAGVTGTGQVTTANGAADTAGGAASSQPQDVLAPPTTGEMTGAKNTGGAGASVSQNEPEVFGTITENGGFSPYAVSTPGSSDHLQQEESATPWFKVTKSAGLITVRAAPEAHRLIESYLARVQEAAHKQVFVEVRIMAIVKNRQTDRGGGLSKNLDLGGTILGKIGFQAASPINEAQASGLFLSAFSQKTGASRDMSAIVQALSTLGDVYTISSPSLLARNNQLSRVSITKQLGYAETKVDQNTTAVGNVVIGARTDTAKFKNAGTVLSVLPFIGKNDVQMRVRLAVASKIGETSIQTSVGSATPITNFVPELSNNVIDQDMVLDYGRVYAIGGLVETSTSTDKTYIPGLNEIPGVSEIFQRANNKKQDTEFIVFLRINRA